MLGPKPFEWLIAFISCPQAGGGRANGLGASEEIIGFGNLQADQFVGNGKLIGTAWKFEKKLHFWVENMKIQRNLHKKNTKKN